MTAGGAMAGKIFVNYRRDDSIGMAGRLHDRLTQTFGPDKIFMDVDNIPVGEDFVAHLNNQVAACDVVLAVIGPNWLKAKDKRGQRRLHQQLGMSAKCQKRTRARLKNGGG